MLAAKTLRSTAAALGGAFAPRSLACAARGMATAQPDGGGIPDDRKGLTGKALDEAMYQEKYGQELYDRDALTFFDEGTKENPICILSEEPERIVGVSLTDDANIRWFNLSEGEMVRDPITHNYFALRVIDPQDIKKAVDAAKEE